MGTRRGPHDWCTLKSWSEGMLAPPSQEGVGDRYGEVPSSLGLGTHSLATSEAEEGWGLGLPFPAYALSSLVLLDQQPQAVGLGQGHVCVHAKVVGAGVILPAQVSARRKVRGQLSGAAARGPATQEVPPKADTHS